MRGQSWPGRDRPWTACWRDDDRRSCEAIDWLTRAIKASSGQRVVVGMAPVNLIRQSTTHLAASGESARRVLSRILDATGEPLPWQLLYDFESSQFFLSTYPLS